MYMGRRVGGQSSGKGWGWGIQRACVHWYLPSSSTQAASERGPLPATRPSLRFERSATPVPPTRCSHHRQPMTFCEGAWLLVQSGEGATRPVPLIWAMSVCSQAQGDLDAYRTPKAG